MKYSHEVPKNLLNTSRFFNDFDYALDIKFDDQEYLNFFKTSVELGREVWLDNSLYERRITGIPFDEEKYVEYISDIKPSYYIVPDSYESAESNINLLDMWISKYNINLIGYGKIVVVHGSDKQDYFNCYRYLNEHIRESDIIAFSGGDSFITDEISRASIIKEMYLNGTINLKRKHHLLGSVNPEEIREYKNLHFITSIDTSLPVITTYENNYISLITEKPKSIIHNIFDDNINWDLNLLYKNISYFRFL